MSSLNHSQVDWTGISVVAVCCTIMTRLTARIHHWNTRHRLKLLTLKVTLELRKALSSRHSNKLCSAQLDAMMEIWLCISFYCCGTHLYMKLTIYYIKSHSTKLATNNFAVDVKITLRDALEFNRILNLPVTRPLWSGENYEVTLTYVWYSPTTCARVE